MVVEQTRPQIFYGSTTLANDQLPSVDMYRYPKFREMRRDPTIALARMLTVAPLVLAGWQYDATDNAPEGAKELIEEIFEPQRVHIVKTALEGYADYGWAPYEIVWGTNDKHQIVITKFKPLLQRWTWILVDVRNGEFVGLHQPGPQEIKLPIDQSLVITIDPEGTNWYGRALMLNVEECYDKWNKVEEAAARYDRKIAGSHWVIHYPIGTTPVKVGSSTVDKDNAEIANDILRVMQSSGCVIVPNKEVPYGDGASETVDAWKIEIINDGGTQQEVFTNRQRYLDALKVRGFGVPERSMLEGQFGTKAEASEHGDFAIVNMELRHHLVCLQLKYLIDLVLTANFGPQAKGTVSITPMTMADETANTLRDIYKTLLTNQDIAITESQNIDLLAIKERLDIPVAQFQPLDVIPETGILTDFFSDPANAQLTEHFNTDGTGGGLLADFFDKQTGKPVQGKVDSAA